MRAAIALGSNLSSPYGDPTANLREAIDRLGQLGRVIAVSSFHETEPVGYTDQPRFSNAALLLETDLAPLELLRRLLQTEKAMGRIRAADVPPKGPRVIDLDLLLYEDQDGRSLILSEPELILPHPELQKRAFVLAPLCEIAPNMLHPVAHRSIRDLFAELPVNC